MKGWKKYSPVDALVISPQFEVIGRQPVNELHSSVGDTARRYLTFLQESLAGIVSPQLQKVNIHTEIRILH